jgi:membrane protein
VNIFSIFRRTYKSFSRHNPSRFGAALAFYLVFTIGPALLVAINVFSKVLGRHVAERRVFHLVTSFFGNTAAAAVTDILKAAAIPNAGWLASAIGISGLFFGVSGMYRQIRDALRAIWHVEPATPVGLIEHVAREVGSGLCFSVRHR